MIEYYIPEEELLNEKYIWHDRYTKDKESIGSVHFSANDEAFHG